jgi:sugar lactone lactonase YvrE
MSKARDIADLGSNDVIETTASGVDVTGTITADGLTVDGVANISGVTADLRLLETDTTDLNTRIVSAAGSLEINTLNDAGTSQKKRVVVGHSTGDVRFYEDTGTTAKFVWDASAEGVELSSLTSYVVTNSGKAVGS